MEKVIFIIMMVLIIATCGLSKSPPPEALFQEANRLYREADFQGAIEAYNKIIKMGFDSGYLHFNLGNAYFKSGKLGYAILHFEKARKLLSYDQDLNHNLTLASQRVADKIEIPRLLVWRYFDLMIKYFNLNKLALFSALFFLLFSGIFTAYYFVPRGLVKKISFYLSVLLFLTFLLFLLIFVIRVWQEQNRIEGVILAEKVEVLSAPDEGAQGLFSLHEGVKVKVKQKLLPWAEISLPDGKKGWVKIETFAEI
jgi:tetratricopeptide (TPR) repeat protein